MSRVMSRLKGKRKCPKCGGKMKLTWKAGVGGWRPIYVCKNRIKAVCGHIEPLNGGGD